MKPTVSIGTQDFEKIRKSHSFYIDKSMLIKEWWECEDDVTLITRPRRFGKTLNLSMVNCFFSRAYEGRGELFEGLEIWKQEKYRQLQGSFPVIYISFADVKGTDYHTARAGIIRKIVRLYSSYVHVRECLNAIDSVSFDLVRTDMEDAVATAAIQNMTDYLYHYYGKKVLILLDEYDTPLQEAYANGYWEKLTAFIRSLFNSTFKTNPYMERGLMTGITRVSKESIFSDLNNLEVITTTTQKYCSHFGFTEREVFDALDIYGMSGEKEKVKQWYDGFTFGNLKDIYNPWSITCFLENRQYKPYWANSSSNRLAGSLIQQGNPQTKMTMEDLLAGKPFAVELDEEVIFDQLQKKRGAIWSLLLAGGYLKVVSKRFDEKSGRFTYSLQLTNREVRMMFEDIVKDWFSNEDIPYNAFLQAFLQGDLDYMNEYMNQVAEQTFSSFDAGNKPSESGNPERFYHGFVLGLIVELAGRYRITSNRKSGFGRYDVMLMPESPQQMAIGKAGIGAVPEGHLRTAYVLEFKVRNPKREKTLEDTLQAALQQIDDKNYDAELTANGICRENIRHYGFAFEGKRVLIG